MAKLLKMNSLDKLKENIESLYEVKRIKNISIELLNKYKTLNELKENRNDSLIIEFKEILGELNSLSLFISETINDELEL